MKMRASATILSSACFNTLLQIVSAEYLSPRNLPEKGGWSLQMEIGGICPSGTATCFSDQTGVSSEFNRTGVEGTFSRGEECCPFGTTPRLDCGTYVNNGQPYACCPLGNADCRGDVEDPSRKGNEQCANPGWALWQIPDGGFNTFCCLPDQYGYWYPHLGQDAVGMCSTSSTLPDGSLPGVQFNNGDNSVSPSGTQLTPLPNPPPPPAPTCSTTHYGWSLQTHNQDSLCPPSSHLCPNTTSCCPSPLTCGTIIGDSEVPVCCPPSNPDCRGDVEGLWPQLCAESNWALWHVNTNGNHFCCPPTLIGYNVPNDNSAVGFCGERVRNGTMRSILDYLGDGSRAGSFAGFPCDSTPAPNGSFGDMVKEILNPPTSLNPSKSLDSSVPVPTGKWENVTFSAGGDLVVELTSTCSQIAGAGSKTEMGGKSYNTSAPQTESVAVYPLAISGVVEVRPSLVAGGASGSTSSSAVSKTEIGGGSEYTPAPQTQSLAVYPSPISETVEAKTSSLAGDISPSTNSEALSKTNPAGGIAQTHPPPPQTQTAMVYPTPINSKTTAQNPTLIPGSASPSTNSSTIAKTGSVATNPLPSIFLGRAPGMQISLAALGVVSGGLSVVYTLL